jgi:uncharacterized protein YdeI (YjbR/CyaY-like superfamily)
MDVRESLTVDTPEEFRRWLQKNHRKKIEIWLNFYRKSSGKQTLTIAQAVEEALCFGWIDSKPNKLDHERSLLWFAPRKPATGWSRSNKERAERMIAAGLMAPAGLAKIEAAKNDGSWTALDAVEELEIPEDLARALASFPHAAAHFAAFPRSAKRGILEWILNAKRHETRAARVFETANLANEDRRANQWRDRRHAA